MAYKGKYISERIGSEPPFPLGAYLLYGRPPTEVTLIRLDKTVEQKATYISVIRLINSIEISWKVLIIVNYR